MQISQPLSSKQERERERARGVKKLNMNQIRLSFSSSPLWYLSLALNELFHCLRPNPFSKKKNNTAFPRNVKRNFNIHNYRDTGSLLFLRQKKILRLKWPWKKKPWKPIFFPYASTVTSNNPSLTGRLGLVHTTRVHVARNANNKFALDSPPWKRGGKKDQRWRKKNPHAIILIN